MKRVSISISISILFLCVINGFGQDNMSIRIPNILNLESMIKDFIQKKIREKAEEWAKEQAIASIKSTFGPMAAIEDFEFDMTTSKVSTEIPILTLGTLTKSFMYKVPEITTVTKSVKFHVPEIKMELKQIGSQKHCKTVWVLKKVGFIKTHVPEVHCWDTPIYTDIPQTKMVLREIKTDFPELTMKNRTLMVDIPYLTEGKTRVSLDVPNIKRIRVKVDGVLRKIVPGSHSLVTFLEILQKAEDFRKELEDYINSTISSAMQPAIEVLVKLQDEIRVQQLDEAYAKIINDIDPNKLMDNIKNSEYVEQIEKLKAMEGHQIQSMLEELEKIHKIIREFEAVKSKAIRFVQSLKLI